MESLSSTLKELEDFLRQSNSPLLERLLPGTDLSKIEGPNDLFRKQDVRDLYAWKNGVDCGELTIGELLLFQNGIMLPAEEACQEYDIAQEEELWEGNLFPLFSNGGGDFLLYDTNTSIGIYYYAPVIVEGTPKVYEDLTTMMKTVLECYKQKSYYWTDGTLKIDYEIFVCINL